MLGTLLTGLSSLRDFLSRAFFVAAFVPTLLFVFLNALMLYLLNWGVHNWIESELFNGDATHRIVVFSALFLGIWILSYLVGALTPFWTRTLEGRNWGVLRGLGISWERSRFESLNQRINQAVAIYARIDRARPGWRADIEKAAAAAPAITGTPQPATAAAGSVSDLRALEALFAMIPFEDINNAYAALTGDIGRIGVVPEVSALAEALTLLTDYASRRAMSEHSRLLAERNMAFGIAEDIAPTLFGNAGLTAEAYAMRAYQCNLPQVWGALRQAAQKDDKLGPALEDAKMQLDFQVACWFLFLFWSLVWAAYFALGHNEGWSVLFATGGPLLAWALWYGAAVERYRICQDLIMSLLDSLRFQVLANLHLAQPADLEEERALWRALDFTIGNGQPGNLRYRPGSAP